MKFEWYVLNYNFNEKKIEMYNIFNNCSLNNAVEDTIKKYLEAPKKFMYIKNTFNENITITGFEGLCKELESLIMWQEWARIEYEIYVGRPFEDDPEKLEKWDCYQQCKPNIPMIAREILWQYKNNLKLQKKRN